MKDELERVRSPWGLATMTTKQKLMALKAELGRIVLWSTAAQATVSEMLDEVSAPSLPKPPANNLAPLFDLIGSAESRHRNFPLGNYNAYYGRAGNTSRPQLTAMTLSEVLEWQQRRIKTVGFSASGRYQIIRKTLLGLMRKHNIRGERFFSEATQDELCMHLLRGRGLDRFLRGHMTVTKFGNSIAREWAGLPMLSGRKMGRSYYAGDGVNKATITVDQVRAALEEVRGG